MMDLDALIYKLSVQLNHLNNIYIYMHINYNACVKSIKIWSKNISVFKCYRKYFTLNLQIIKSSKYDG